MTTEHVSVPRELLEELMWTWKLEAQVHAEKGNYVRCDLTHKHADELKDILSRATPSPHEVIRKMESELPADIYGREPSAPRVVTDAIALINRMKEQHTNTSTTCHVSMEQLNEVQAALESFATSLPAARVPGRKMLRAIVDAAWMEATETEQVPSTIWADRIIDSVLAAAPQVEKK